MSARALTRVAALGCALALLALGPACTRKPRLVPASAADSTRAAVDSFTVWAREATDRWESGLDDEAAPLSARVVRQALIARPNGPWPERARGVLDSLGIGSEAAGGERATVVNLFSRSDPEGQSWPYLFWRDAVSVRFQQLDARGLHLTEVATRDFGTDSAPTDSAQAAVLWGRRVGSGQQPLLMVWHYARGGRWDLEQTMGADSLGGTGTGEFSASDSTQELVVRTYRPTPFFDECTTCPHVFRERRLAWGPDGFHGLDDRPVPSPYATFTGFVSALVANDRERAAQYVVDRSLVDFARRFEWNVPVRGRWRVAPGTDEGAIEMVVLRGAKDAFRVRFESREGEWVIAGFEPTTRAIE